MTRLDLYGLPPSIREAILAVAPSPGVWMRRRVLLDAVQILLPDIRRDSAGSLLSSLSSDPCSRLVRLRPGVYTTRPAKSGAETAA